MDGDGLHTDPETGCAEGVSRKASLSRARIVNTINYLHSQGKSVHVVFRHLRYNSRAIVEAFPQPCEGGVLSLQWTEDERLKDRTSSYALRQILIEVGRYIFSMEPSVLAIDDHSITLDMSQAVGTDLTVRKVERWPCQGIELELVQNGIVFRGALRDFSAYAFSANMDLGDHPSFNYINAQNTVNVLIKKEGELLYSGECRIIRHDGGTEQRTFAFEPVTTALSRFRQKIHRSPRHRLLPSPYAAFVHPFTGRLISLAIEEIAGSGFSVIEEHESSTLLRGMILPKLDIEFAFGMRVSCRAQVISHRVLPETDSASQLLARSGIAFLEMDPAGQTLVASLLHQATNPNAYVCSRVDIDELWKFFFSTGFIYPKKYMSLRHDIEGFRKTYRKLYLESPAIARHFIYQSHGRIQAHISMVRFFEDAWLCHHHASMGLSRAGLIVLDQIGRYVNDVYNIHSSHMQYLLCYFRPDNRFPNRVFGGYAQHAANVRICSLDDFAHMILAKGLGVCQLPESAELEYSTASDLSELDDYYSQRSGGLMMTAFQIGHRSLPNSRIRQIYEKNEMKRECLFYSLRELGDIKAIFIANITDLGLNMSNLTNCVTAFVLDETLGREQFLSASSRIVDLYQEDEVPLLVYPATYAKKAGLQCDKVYRLWSFDTQYTDHYLDFVSRFLRRQSYGRP